MKSTSVIAVMLAATLFLVGVSAVAQHAGHDPAGSAATASPDMMAQHQKMMAQHQEIGKLIDELAKDFSALQSENDPAQLKKKLAEDNAKVTELQSKFQAASGMMGRSMDHSAMMQQMMQHQRQSMAGMHGQQQAGATPTLPGQDAFGAIQEIVRMLEADPATDWSKVNLEALRQHLIDMNEVTLKAGVAAKQIEGGLDIAVTGTGRTLAAIQRMVPDHAQMINGLNGLERQDRDTPERRPPHCYRRRSQGNRAYPRTRVHRDTGERLPPPAAPSRDSQGRVRARALKKRPGFIQA
jgi:hypothetical protein